MVTESEIERGYKKAYDQTELVQLNWDNDGDTYNLMCSEARSAIEAHTGEDSGLDESGATYALAEFMKSYSDECAEKFMATQTGYLADLLNWGLNSVEWFDIAASYITHVRAGQ
jgi:hypothetical protein